MTTTTTLMPVLTYAMKSIGVLLYEFIIKAFTLEENSLQRMAKHGAWVAQGWARRL
jgi:hypothetical protein